jgi:hypothetical protein
LRFLGVVAFDLELKAMLLEVLLLFDGKSKEVYVVSALLD